MKSKWLLLMVSVLCLLMLFPAAALSQGPVIEAGCGAAEIDGIVYPAEWAEAAVVPLVPSEGPVQASRGGAHALGEVTAAQEPEGIALVMNTLTHMYVAALVTVDGIVLDPDYAWPEMWLDFTDEGDPLDDEFEAPDCDPLPMEGGFGAWEDYQDEPPDIGDEFEPYSQSDTCEGQPLIGVAWDVNIADVWEWGVDLTDSELDNMGPGDCFRFGIEVYLDGCEEGSGCDPTGAGDWYRVDFYWPADLDYEDAATYGTLCLNPCEPEEVEFVPEPGTIMLLGSGLAGLAGYATLRWRTRK